MTNNDGAYAAAIDLANAGVSIAAVVDLRWSADGRAGRPRRAAKNIEILDGHAITAHRGPPAGQRRHRPCARSPTATASPARRARSTAICSCIPAAGTRPCICSRSRAASLRFDDAHRRLRAGQVGAEASARPAPARQLRARRLPRRGLRGRAGRRRATPASARAIPAARPSAAPAGTVDAAAPGLAGALRQAGGARLQGLRRPPERRHRGRRAAGPPRGLSLGRAPRSATPPSAWAPTRARPATSTRSPSWRRRSAAMSPQVGITTFRPPYTPVTIGAFGGHERGDLFDPHPPHRAASLARERTARKFENVGQWRRAWYYPRPGETMHDAVNREVKATRSGRRHPRCLDARQDRHPGTGRRRAAELGLHQRLEQARDRPLPLRPDAAARTAWCSTTASPRASANTIS